VAAVRAADAGEALVQVAALQKCLHRAFDDRAPEAVLSRKPLVVDLLESLEMLVQHHGGEFGRRAVAQRSELPGRAGDSDNLPSARVEQAAAKDEVDVDNIRG
jgi:hypothetical protein